MSIAEQTLTIPDGAAVSNVWDLSQFNFRNQYWSLLIVAPATLPEVVNIQVATKTTATFGILQSSGVDIVIPAGRAIQLLAMAGGAVKLLATGNVSPARIFQAIIRGF